MKPGTCGMAVTSAPCCSIHPRLRFRNSGRKTSAIASFTALDTSVGVSGRGPGRTHCDLESLLIKWEEASRRASRKKNPGITLGPVPAATSPPHLRRQPRCALLAGPSYKDAGCLTALPENARTQPQSPRGQPLLPRSAEWLNHRGFISGTL